MEHSPCLWVLGNIQALPTGFSTFPEIFVVVAVLFPVTSPPARAVPATSPPPCSHGADDRLPDLPRRLGLERGEAHVWGQNGQIHAGRLHRALGVHPLHHRHPRRAHPLLPGLRAGQPAGQPPPVGF